MALTKAKLIEQLDSGDYDDHLPAGGSMTDEEILDAVKRVDGAGSGLDADMLDGNEGSYFLPAGSYTAADVLAKIKTVDGAGSGLDADMLDGYHANEIMRMQIFNNYEQLTSSTYIWNVIRFMPNYSILYQGLSPTHPLVTRTTNKFPAEFAFLVIIKVNEDRFAVSLYPSGSQTSEGVQFWRARVKLTSSQESISWYRYSGTLVS